MAAGSLVLTQVSTHGSYFPDIFIGLLLCGLGIGLAFVTATAAALAGVAEHEAGLASGLSNTALQTGTALGVAIVTTVAVSRSQHYLAADNGANPLAALTQGYQSASWPAPYWPGSAWRWRSCSPADRGSQRTSCQSRTRRPMPLPQETW
jgi:MFS family permease